VQLVDSIILHLRMRWEAQESHACSLQRDKPKQLYGCSPTDVSKISLCDPLHPATPLERDLLKLAGPIVSFARQCVFPRPRMTHAHWIYMEVCFCPTRPFTRKNAACLPRVQRSTAVQMGLSKIRAHAAGASKPIVCSPPEQDIPPPRRMHQDGEDVSALGFPQRHPVRLSVQGWVPELRGRFLPESPVIHPALRHPHVPYDMFHVVIW
jgi:hypothetical protein